MAVVGVVVAVVVWVGAERYREGKRREGKEGSEMMRKDDDLSAAEGQDRESPTTQRTRKPVEGGCK